MEQSAPDDDPQGLLASVMKEFLASTRAYDVIPQSGKVVVLDTLMPLRLAFYALVEHGEWLRAAE